MSKYTTEVPGHTIRVVDSEGNDVALFGRCDDPANVQRAQDYARYLNRKKPASS